MTAQGTYRQFNSTQEYKQHWYSLNREKRLKQERERRENPEQYLTKMLQRAKKNAAKRGLSFDITMDDLEITEYCPIFFWVKLTTISGEGFVDTNMSLDRKDNSKGYVKGNIHVICYKANRNKNNSTLDELVALGRWAENVSSVLD